MLTDLNICLDKMVEVLVEYEVYIDVDGYEVAGVNI